MKHQKVVIIDFGSQYVQLIARRVRESHVYCEIKPYTISFTDLIALEPDALILSGGPATVTEDGAPSIDPEVFNLGIPVLGICYGMQLMAHLLGGQTATSTFKEYGRTQVDFSTDNPLFNSIVASSVCWMSHGIYVEQIPDGWVSIASTADTLHTAMANREKCLYGVQFHPEVTHTEYGEKVIKNFLFDIAGLKADWSMSNFLAEQIERIKQQVGQGRVLCALSGGVDSSVTAAIIHRAIGDQLSCVFVNHGLMRLNEPEQVVHLFRDVLGTNLIVVNAAERFLGKLAGVIDPEQKRKIIGNEFIRVFEEQAELLDQPEYLAQGTLYPDVVESGTATAAVIKSHHNVGGLPEDMKFKLVEPLRELFKDEVRELGRELGLPEYVIQRQPFPGPGLGIRCLGEVTEEKLSILRKADAIFREEHTKNGCDEYAWQTFAVLPNIRSVGVMGDSRTYSHAIILRSVQSVDGMTADWVRLPYEVLDRVATRIIAEVPEVNRVAYDITSKPPGTVEWE